jgi:hypothetical protein
LPIPRKKQKIQTVRDGVNWIVYAKQDFGWRIDMRPAHLALTLALTASTLLGACAGDRAPSLMNLRSDSNGPDEFSILPTKPLQMPEDIAALPQPTPGGRNLVDPNPAADAIVALGGTPRDENAASSGDGGIISYASRGGVTGDIRGILAAEDLEYRKQNNGLLLERLFNVTTYFKAYRRQSLDQQVELARWRAKGIATPSAPPAE